MNIRSIAAICAATVLAGTAQAAAVYTSSAWPLLDTTPPAAGWCSPCAGHFETLNPFTLGTQTTLTGGDVAQALYATGVPAPSSIRVDIYDADHSTVLDTATFASGEFTVTSVLTKVDELSFTLPSWTLGAGRYWIGFYAAGADEQLLIGGYASHSADVQVLLDPSEDYFPSTSAALRLDGVPLSAVPEPAPAVLALLGAGLAGVRARRRR